MSNDILDNNLENTPNDLGEIRFAGFWIRVGASIIDSLVMIPIIMLHYYNTLTLKNLLLAIVLALISAAYKPMMEYYYSATVGKMMLKIEVVDYQFQAISAEQALIRYLPWMLSVVVSILAVSSIFQMDGFMEIHDFDAYGELASTSPYQKWIQFSTWIVPISAFGILFNLNRQAIHDQMAKTYCVYRSEG